VPTCFQPMSPQGGEGHGCRSFAAAGAVLLASRYPKWAGSWGSANLVRSPDSARVCVLMAAVALTGGYRERPSRGPICYAVAVATGRPGAGITGSDCSGLLPADWTGCRHRPR
jgi:hypothetical protein